MFWRLFRIWLSTVLPIDIVSQDIVRNFGSGGSSHLKKVTHTWCVLSYFAHMYQVYHWERRLKERTRNWWNVTAYSQISEESLIYVMWESHDEREPGRMCFGLGVASSQIFVSQVSPPSFFDHCLYTYFRT